MAYEIPSWSKLEDNAVKIETRLDQCKGDDPHPSTDRACLRSAAQDWDDQLNTVYQFLMSDLKPPVADALKKSEKQWIDFQQAEIKAIDSLLGKPDSNVAYERAQMQLPKTRAEELRVSASDYDVPDLGQPTEDCLSNARDTKSKSTCYIKRLNIAEGNMKGTYELLLSKLTPGEQNLLQNSQKQWREFQSTENTYIDRLHPQIGSAVNINAIAAKMNVIENRTQQFDFFLRNYQKSR